MRMRSAVNDRPLALESKAFIRIIGGARTRQDSIRPVFSYQGIFKRILFVFSLSWVFSIFLPMSPLIWVQPIR